MADPRGNVSFEGIGYRAITIAFDDTIVYDATKVGGSEQVGKAVSIESNRLVTLAGDGENVLGKLIKVEPDFCVVQIEGMCQLPGGDGATLTAGLKIVGDLGSGAAEGFIQAVSTQDTVSRGMIIDSSVASAVWVWLG